MSRSSDVPQATLARIRAVVDACVAGADTTTAIGQSTKISSRHVDYAVAAAEALHFLHHDVKSRIVPTPAGKRLAATERGSLQEHSVFAEAIEASPVVQRIAPDLLSSTPPSKEDIAQRITESSALGKSTALHRAAMLLKWRSILPDTQPRRERHPKGKDAAGSGGGLWRRVEIRNYRSIATASVELAPFTVVVGPNGSGKSNFADALVFARDISSDASTAIGRRGGITGVRRWRPLKPTDVTVDIRAAKSKKGLESDYARHMFKIHSELGGQWSFSQEAIELVSKNSVTTSLLRRGSTLVKSDGSSLPGLTETASGMILAAQLREFTRTSALRNVRRYRLNPEEMRQPQLSTEQTRLGETGANIAVAVRAVRNSERREELLLAMSHIVPGLQDIYEEQVGRYLALKFRQAQGEGELAEFNATEMSEGALRALGIVVATLQMVPEELLIIEEPEVSVHVGAATLLFEVLKEASTRGAVLITTHSADLLDAAKDEEILVCEYRQGITRIGPLATSQRDVVRQGLFTVAELMRSEPLRIDENTPGAPKGS